MNLSFFFKFPLSSIPTRIELDACQTHAHLSDHGYNRYIFVIGSTHKNSIFFQSSIFLWSPTIIYSNKNRAWCKLNTCVFEWSWIQQMVKYTWSLNTWKINSYWQNKKHTSISIFREVNLAITTAAVSWSNPCTNSCKGSMLPVSIKILLVDFLHILKL